MTAGRSREGPAPPPVRIPDATPAAIPPATPPPVAAARPGTALVAKLMATLIAILALAQTVLSGAAALEPAGVAVIVNDEVPEGVALARDYMERRGIPADHLIRLATSTREALSREAFEAEIRDPVQDALLRMPDPTRIQCLVLMYGMPLRVHAPAMTEAEQAAATELERELTTLKARIEQATSDEARRRLKANRENLSQALKTLKKEDNRASVDSELMLVLCGDPPLAGWLPNPYFPGFQGHESPLTGKILLLVSRLDGPDPASVRRIIDDSLFAEAEGLSGTAYFDARWSRPTKEDVSGYALYDRAIHFAADAVERSGRMPVMLDARSELFGDGDCPNAAIYCGWYRLGHYVDAFDWATGAVGFHIASSECVTLKREGSQVWCKRMIEDGVAATIGPVAEPYVQGFPLPDVFFGALLEGRLALAECYLVGLPYLSWQMVLIGDPLYRPFAPRPGPARDP